MFEFGRGGKKLEEKGLVEKVIDDDGGEWIKPTKQLIEFIWERTRQYSPRKETEK